MAALCALLISWFAGGLHLALEHTPGGACHHAAAGSCLADSATHGHCNFADDNFAADDFAADGEGAPEDPRYRSEVRVDAHDCAVPQLLAEGSSHAPGQIGCLELAGSSVGSPALAWRAPPHERIPRFLIAPKNSPPVGAARVLA